MKTGIKLLCTWGMHRVLFGAIFLIQALRGVSAASFDPLLLDGISAVWKNGNTDDYSLIYRENGTTVRQPLDPQSVRYFCWVPLEVHESSELDAVPQIKNDLITIGSAPHYDDNDLHLRKIADTQREMVTGDSQIPFSRQNMAITVYEDVVIITWRVGTTNRMDRTGYAVAPLKEYERMKNTWSVYTPVWKDIKLTHKEKIVMFRDSSEERFLVGEDMRLMVLSNGSLWASWCIHWLHEVWMVHAELHYDKAKGDLYSKRNMAMMMAHERITVATKNWVMFEYKHNQTQPPLVLYVFSLQPLRVVMPTTRKRTTYHEQSKELDSLYDMERVNEQTISLSAIKNYCWNYGTMRGGSPAILIGDEYLGFFHSSTHVHDPDIGTYFMGAYTMSSKPPFRITAMSKFPIASPTFVDGWTYKNLDFCIFPMSFTYDDHNIYVTYGKFEKEGWVVRLNRAELYRSLRPVESVVLGECDSDENGQPDPQSFAYLNVPEANDLCHGPCEMI